jgi:hypothetical protein
MRRRLAGAIAIGGAAAAYTLLARPRHLRWGTTGQEADEALPGDDLIAKADLTATRAITIRAPADQAWPWIAQLGQGRGGFYSYDFLENVVGCDIHSADRIVPEWQDVRVGDQVRLAPEVALFVVFLERGRSLVLRGGIPIGKTAPPYDFTWAFTLRDRPDGTTRLLVRERYGYTRPWAPLIVEPAEAVSFLMSQRMLRGIRDRAERSPALGENSEDLQFGPPRRARATQARGLTEGCVRVRPDVVAARGCESDGDDSSLLSAPA